MAAQKSLAGSAGGKRRSRAPMRGPAGEGARKIDHVELLEDLSAQLALVETASIALQKFEDQEEIGAICASLEHAVSMLADAHERVDASLRLARRQRD